MQRKKIWSLSTLIAATDFLYFNINDKIIIIIGKDNTTKWITPVFTQNTRNGLLLMQNDGNLVVHDHCGRTFGNLEAVENVAKYQVSIYFIS